MAEKIQKPRKNPDVDSRLSYEEEQTQIDLLNRSGMSIDWTSGTIRAKQFIGDGTGLWNVGEGTGTGPKGDDGDPGEDGKDFTYDMFTEEQLADLKGEKGDPFVYDDFTKEQLEGLKGEQGEPGAGVDPEQLDAIQAELAKQTVDISKNTADIAAHDVRDNNQDTVIEANTASIDAIEPIVTQHTSDIADNTADIIKLGDDIANAPSIDAYTKNEIDTQQLTQDEAIQANAEAIEAIDIPEPVDAYTKTATDTLLDSKANVGDSYTKAESYTNVEVDAKLFTKADKETTYTKDEVDTIVGDGGGGDVDLSNYYTKEEVDASQAAQDGHIVELEEELEAIAPSIVSGQWWHQTNGSSSTTTPVSGHFWLQNTSGTHETDLSKVTSLVFSSIKSSGASVSNDMAKVQPGALVELFESDNSESYMLGRVTRVYTGSYKFTVNLMVEQSIGSISDTKEPGVRLKFFNELADHQTTYTKAETYSKDEVDEIVKDIDTGGGGGGEAAPLHNLLYESRYNTPQAITGPSSFCANYNNPKDASHYYFLRLEDENGDLQDCINYEATPNSMFEMWEGNELIVKHQIFGWKPYMMQSTMVDFQVKKLNNKTGIMKPNESFVDANGTGKRYMCLITNLKRIN